MPRCDYDVIFYRVFCITLLAIAFTFTVILTNVFVDIDGLLSNEEKAKVHEPPSKLEPPIDQLTEEPPPNHQNFEVVYNIDKQLEFEGENIVDRSKRSLDTNLPKYKAKNQKLKQLLTRQLATLLEEIDAEAEEVTKKTDKFDSSLIPDSLDDIARKYLIEEDAIREKDENLLHSAIHHLLINGITSHIDLHKMYRAIHDMKKNLKTSAEKIESTDKSIQTSTTDKPITNNIESSNEIRLMDELANCDGLHKEMTTFDRNSVTEKKVNEKKVTEKKVNVKKDNEKKFNESLPANIVINTLIDIKKDDKSINKTGKENIKGIIKLIYNGQNIEISKPDEETEQKNSTSTSVRSILTEKPAKANLVTAKIEKKNTPEYYFKKALADYATKYYRPTNNKVPIMNELFSKSRPKRQISGNMKDMLAKHRDKNNTRRHQDELFVEIETHIDNRDLRNDKRKNKVVKNLIEKIQHAIYSNLGNLQTKEKKKHRIIQIKKRLLSPVDDKIVNKISVPMEPITHRQLDPISKVLNTHNMDSKSITNLAESNTKHQPNFLTNAKTINSAENGNVHVAYEKVFGDIPQRYQIPLYSEYDDALRLGNLKFSFKNIDGAGLAIGFNQYVDTTPDGERFIIFDRLEKMMESLPEAVDEMYNTKNSTVTDTLNKQLLKTMVNLHDISKREINLQDIYENQEKDNRIYFPTHFEPNAIKDTKNSMVFDYGVGFKDLLSLEQNDEKLTNGLGLDAFDRTKRYASQVRQISSIKNKVKLNKYLNTDVMASKSLLWKKNRLKRDLSNIYLSDMSNPALIAPENVNDTPYYEHSVDEELEGVQLYDDRQQREIDSYVNSNVDRTFSVLAQPSLGYLLNENGEQTPLMSKYPHIIMGGFDKSKEYDVKTKISLKQDSRNDVPPLRARIPIQTDDNVPFEELVNAIAPKTGYKVTVKLAPKNQSQFNVETRKMNTAFSDHEKEVVEERNDELEEDSEKIEQELESLLQQKETLENIFKERQRDTKSKDLIDLLLPFNPPKILHLNKEDVGNLIKTALKKLKDLNPSANDKSYVASTTMSTTTTTTTTTSRDIPTTTNPGIGIDDLKAITNEILNKIERNTNYFQIFLKKLTERLDQSQKVEEPKRNSLFRRMLMDNSTTPKNEVLQTNKELIPHVLNQGPIMLPSVPSFEVNKNGTFIPFIYAYQHALPSVNGSKSSDNLANVVYHGHIHANTIPNKKRNHHENMFFKDKKQLNNSRYFLDELDRSRPQIKLFKLMKKPGNIK